MKHFFRTVALLLISIFTFGQQIKKVDTEWIKYMRQHPSDTLYIVNFWATWCKPCVAEMPIFDSLANLLAHEKIKVILVSNDMKKDFETRLENFISDHHIHQEVVWMNETNADKWISETNNSWSGAIPATWFICPSRKVNEFHEGELSYIALKRKTIQLLK
jgi:thiol-disulfide isomerase/thioredoxin